MWNAKKFDEAVKALPALYATEGVKAENKIIVMHVFMGANDWYICEGDAEEGLLFGYTCIGGDWEMAEWGYSYIEELKATLVPVTVKVWLDGRKDDSITRNVPLDFDLHWTPCRFADIPAVRENLYFDPETAHSKRELLQEA